MLNVPRLPLVSLLALLALPFMGVLDLPPARGEPEATVQAFVRAFNERDLDGLLSLTHEDVEWLSVAGTKITAETRGRLALAESLEAYFEACPTCQSTLGGIMPAGSRVATFERASWVEGSGQLSQVSLAVYDLEDGAIRRVYYHPAERLLPVEGETGEDER